MHMYICIYINEMLYKYQYHHKTLLKQIILHKMYKFQANLQINGSEFTKLSIRKILLCMLNNRH